ncbi:MAG: hypothetical protein ACREDV_09945 [Methylocella sp.]
MTVRQKLSIIDVIGIVHIVLGFSMTVLNFLAARRSIAEAEPVTIRKSGPSVDEIAPSGSL